MKDIHIKIKKGGTCKCSQTCIGQEGENLQGNLIFEFCDEFIDGIGYVEIQQPNGTKGYMPASKVDETYVLPIKSSLLNQVGQLQVQLRITQEIQGEEIPVFKSEIHPLVICNSINATATIPDEYPTWIDTANEKIAEIDEKIEEVETLNITAEKVDTTTTITITDKQGVEHETEVLDGIQGETGATGTSVTGISKTSTSGLVDTYTMSFSDGDTTTYDVTNGFSPIANIETNGANSVVTITDELGTTTATIHTPVRGTDYWTNTDKEGIVADVLASEEVQQIELDVASANETSQEAESLALQCNKAKGYTNYQTLITELNSALNNVYLVGQSFLVQTLEVPDLWVYSVEETSTPYTYVDDATFVSAIETNGYVQVGYYKISMLETIKQDLTNYVKNTDYASQTRKGVVGINNSSGIRIDVNNNLYLDTANNSEIDRRVGQCALKIYQLNYAIGSALPVMTQAQYDAIVTKDANLYYMIEEEE